MASKPPAYRRIAQLKTAEVFRAYLESLGIDLSFDEQVIAGPESLLGQPYHLKDGFTIGNRFCIQPMEGWDGTPDGRPSAHTLRRWTRFGESGAKLIWGGEAVAVRHDGRANPNQLLINPKTLPELARLRLALVEAHEARHGSSQDLLIGLQLTHSGRFSRPNRKDRPEPVIAYHHPYLDERLGLPPDAPLISDAGIEALIEDFAGAAGLAKQAGFAFVDIKHCHGYLGHELLSATTRAGPYGGSFENRTRFLRQTAARIRARAPGLRLGVRLSAFDSLPFMKDPGTGAGRPVPRKGGACTWFGANPADPLAIDLAETTRFLALLEELGIELVNLTAGSPYYNPHIQRPALFPPSDGYSPPEDPLVGVARQIGVVAELKRRFPGLAMVGTAYSYLQEWLANVAQHHVRTGKVDFVGLGRMVLAYPHFPADVLAGRPPDRKRLCRTFSDCTTAPRNGLISGCYPLDDYYTDRPEAEVLAKVKKGRE
jgi:2,4-dienoyl-CoA reductase-like NADH-dependent reductase (Old Yellow Enzyme family)